MTCSHTKYEGCPPCPCEDTNEYAEGLAAIKERILPGYWRSIDCDRGWYPLLVALDKELAAIDPDYQVLQVKEKFGGLRYYYGLDATLACCDEWEAENPQPPAAEAPVEEWNAWGDLLTKHEETPEHTYAETKRQMSRDEIKKIVYHYERLSQITCEWCGERGELCLRGSWYKTLCDKCANEGGYEKVPEDEG